MDELQKMEDSALSQLGDAYYDSKQYPEAIKLANEILDNPNFGDETQRIAKWIRASSYSHYAFELKNSEFSWRDKENKDAFDILQHAKDLFYEYGNEYGWDDDIIYDIMVLDNFSEQFIGARDKAIILMDSDNKDYKSMAYAVYKGNTKRLFEAFEEYAFTDSIEYSHRKYLFIGRDETQIAGTYQLYVRERIIDWIFTIDQLPADMVFPLGRPQPGLYMAHPVKTDHYFPMKGVEETLFMEKVREFCWFVQCLGATEVSFHSNKGLSVSQGMGSSTNVNAEMGVRKVNVGGGYGNSMKRDESYNSSQQVELVQHFSPKKQAYCPDDLIWLDSDPAWQMLLKQRLEGGILEYTYKISSSATCQVSANEMEKVKANFEYIMVKAHGSYNATTDNTFSQNEETEWSIYVKFAPLENLTEQNSSNTKDDLNLLDNEVEYLDMIKECIEDGEIGVRERKLLDKIRVKNGISEERAKELEASLSTPQLTDDEKEYLEAFKDACEDGVVSDKQRCLLEKLRVMYGISEERARQLEK